MELFLILKILFVIVAILALYAVNRNVDIMKIILLYWKDLIFRQ